MGANANAPIIIKRKKVISGGGHHGGAWKVAYADFVTAMMAFFMLMWLLNATTEQQRKGIADYFTPTIAFNRVSGGGDGMFGGDDFLSSDTAIRQAPGGVDVPLMSEEAAASAAQQIAEVDALLQVEQVLLGQGGESLLSDQALRHVVTRLTDEGLVIEIFALPGTPLFRGLTAEPLPLTRDLIEMIARVSAVVPNPVSIEAHMAAQPIILAENPVWNVTAARVQETRRIMETAGLDATRTQRMTAHGDRTPATQEALAPRNDRLEIILLRQAR